MTLAAHMSLDATQFTNPLAGAMSQLSNLGNIATGINASLSLVGKALNGIGSAINEAAGLESLKGAFEPLLGNADAAKERLGELEEFAKGATFSMPEILTASKTLQGLTSGVLATGAGFQLVADTAAATNVKLEDMADTVGKLYNGLQNGKPISLVMQKLQTMGAISADTRSKIESLADSGMGAEAWALAEQSLQRFTGSMDGNAQQWTGKLQIFRNSISEAMAAFGEPIMDSAKPALDALASMAQSLKPMVADLGESVGKAFTALVQAFESGQLGDLIGTSLKAGFEEAVNWIFGAFKALAQLLGSGDFWIGIVSALASVGAKITEIFLKAFKTPIQYFQAAIQKVVEEFIGVLPDWIKDKMGMGGFKARSFSEIRSEQNDTRETADAFGKMSNEAFDQASTAFSNALKSVGGVGKMNVLDSGVGTELKNLFASLLDARPVAEDSDSPQGAFADDGSGDGWGGSGKRSGAPDVDALTRVGLVMGDYANLGQSEQQQTNKFMGTLVELTKNTVKNLERIADNIGTGGGGATWQEA